MTFNITKNILIAAMAVAVAAHAGKLTLSIAPSNGFAKAGSQTNDTALVSVSDEGGNPVTGLRAANIWVNVFLIPGGAPCGFQANGTTEIKPGFYQVALTMPGSCVWTNGDFDGAVRIFLPGKAGMAPFKVTIKP